jgi:hypothetical protein
MPVKKAKRMVEINDIVMENSEHLLKLAVRTTIW